MTVTQQFATRLLDALEAASVRTDAGVQSVVTYLAAYPGQLLQDISGGTGFPEPIISAYLSALDSLVAESSGGYFRLTPTGEAVLNFALGARPFTAAPMSRPTLTPAQLARWAEVRKIVMDATVDGGASVREMMAAYYEVQDGLRVPTDEEATDLSCFFANQGYMGLSIHRPGTVPAVFMKHLVSESHDYFELEDTDAEVIELALRAGYTFW